MNDLEFKPEKTTPRKKHYGLRIFLALLGGISIGVAGTIGTVALVVTKVPSKKVINLFGADPNAILTSKYQDKSLYQFVMSLVNGEADFSSASGIAKITPLIEKIIDEISSYAKDNLGIEFDKEELMNTKFAELPTYLLDKFQNSLFVADLINADETSMPIYQLISFEKDEFGNYDYSKKYTFSYLMDNLSSILNSACLKEIITINESDSLYPFRNTMVKDLDATIKNTPIKDLVNLGDNPTRLIQTIGNYTFSNIANSMNELEIGDVIEDTSNSIVNYLVENHTKLNDIPSTISSIPLNRLFEAKDGEELPFALSSVLNKVKGYDVNGDPIYYTLDEIDDCYENLCIGDIFDYSSSDISSNKLISCIEPDTKLNDIPEAFNDITIGKAFHDDIYEEVDIGGGVMVSRVQLMWEYLLHNPDTDKPLSDASASDEEKFSGLSLKLKDDISTLIDNMTKNTSNATLFDLYDHDIACVSDPNILNKKIIGDTSGRRIGDYTYAGFFQMLNSSGLLID